MDNSNLNIFFFGYTSVLGKQIVIDLNKKFKKSNFYLFSRNISELQEIDELNENKFNKFSIDLFDLEKTKEIIFNTKLLCNNKLDIVIFCSISKTNMPFNKIDEHKIFYDINVNILSQILIIKSILPLMIKKNFGHVINISSGTSIFGLPKTSLYSLSKASLQSFFESLYFEFYKKNIYFKNFFTGKFDESNSSFLSKKIADKIFSTRLNIYLRKYVYLAFLLKIFPSLYNLLNIIKKK